MRTIVDKNGQMQMNIGAAVADGRRRRTMAATATTSLCWCGQPTHSNYRRLCGEHARQVIAGKVPA